MPALLTLIFPSPLTDIDTPSLIILSGFSQGKPFIVALPLHIYRFAILRFVQKPADITLSSLSDGKVSFISMVLGFVTFTFDSGTIVMLSLVLPALWKFCSKY